MAPTPRLVTYSMNISLDGYIVGPDGGFDWSEPDEEVFAAHTDERTKLVYCESIGNPAINVVDIPAFAAAAPNDRIIVFGSFLTVGGVLENGEPRPPAPHLPA